MYNNHMIKLIEGKFENIDFNKLEKPNLIFADPPDNCGMKYDNYDDKIDNNHYIELLNIWITKACQITQGPVFFSFAEKWTPYIENIILINKIKLIQRLYWHFNFGQSNKKRYTPSMRPIYWLNNDTIYADAIKIPSARQTKYNDKRAKSGGKLPDNIWEYSRICGTFKEKRKWHVNQFPESLIERIIKGHSKPGDTILDPFLGSGTTALVCQKLQNRKCIGIDISPCYIEKIKEELYDRSKNN